MRWPRLFVSQRLEPVAIQNSAIGEAQRLARTHAIFAAHRKGQPLQQIADTHGISRERVRQILIGGTLSQLPGTEKLSPITRGLLIRLGYDCKEAVLADINNGKLHFGCTFGMGASRFSEIETWAQELNSATVSPCCPMVAPEEMRTAMASFNTRTLLKVVA